jgi:hypothetical protein
MKEKLDNTVDIKEIKQTLNKRETILFRDSAISKLSKQIHYYKQRKKKPLEKSLLVMHAE